MTDPNEDDPTEDDPSEDDDAAPELTSEPEAAADEPSPEPAATAGDAEAPSAAAQPETEAGAAPPEPPPPPASASPAASFTRRNGDAMLASGIDYYASAMQPRFRGLLGRLLGWLFGPVRLEPADAERVRELAEKGVVVYVSRSRSGLEYLLFNHTFVRHDLPLAKFANNINLMAFQPLGQLLRTGWAKLRYLLRGRRLPDPGRSGYLEALTRHGGSSLLFLFRPGTWFDRWMRPDYEPLEAIVQAARAIDKPVYLVPTMVLWEKSAPSLQRSLGDAIMGPRLEPGFLRRLFVLWRYRKQAFVRLSEPLELGEFLERDAARPLAEQARKLRWVLRNRLFRELRVILGPPKKPRKLIIERVIRRMRPELEALAQRKAGDNDKQRSKTLDKLIGEARSCVDEIASDPDRGWIDVWKGLIVWFQEHLYDGIDGLEPEVVEELKRRMKKAPLVVIPNHRSHIDYQLVLNYLDDCDIVPPLVAAGINLAFWPLGPFARRCHAFFIRRSFRNAVYAMAFRHYMAYVLREGYPIMFFAEGTRSRAGKVLPAKLGMLTMLVETYIETKRFDDLTLVPLALGYDKLVEEDQLMAELSGQPKQAESLAGLLQIHRFLQRRYGRISVRVGDLISLKEFLARNPVPEGAGRGPETRAVLQRLGAEVVHQLASAQAVHASALLATVLLSRREGICTYDELLRGADRLLEALAHVDAPLAPPLQRSPDQALRDAIALFQTGNLVKLEQDLDPWGHADAWSGVLTVDPQRRAALDYYRNNALHHFCGLSMLAWSLDIGDGDWERALRDFSFLWELLAREFQHHPDARWQDEAERAAGLLERKRYLERSFAGDGSGDGARTYTIPERARRRLAFYRTPLAPTLEAYRTALRFLALIERGGQRPSNQVLSLVSYAQMELRRDRLRWPESVSTELYKNALGFFKANAERGFDHFHQRLDALARRAGDLPSASKAPRNGS